VSTYVLVHGAWHGSWCWPRVSTRLRAKGHEVFTPTLTGLGEREHLASKDIDLDTHIADVVKLLEFEDLHDVVLVGHSYGGFVVTGVVDDAASRLKGVVYLDAFVPPAGGVSTLDMLGEAGAELRALQEDFVPVPDPPLGDFGVKDPTDLAWIRGKMRPHPRRTFAQGVKMPWPLETRNLQLNYVLATGEGTTLFYAVAERLRAMPEWHVTELATGHDMMVTMPEELTGILLSLG
jgi:pimeloyl-ACP methyl ester carboxylesterase